jgi:hypothetical protein
VAGWCILHVRDPPAFSASILHEPLCPRPASLYDPNSRPALLPSRRKGISLFASLIRPLIVLARLSMAGLILPGTSHGRQLHPSWGAIVYPPGTVGTGAGGGSDFLLHAGLA